MSAALPSLHCSTPSAIAPHFLHSPPLSPTLDMHNLMDPYTEQAPESPYSLRYPSPAVTEAYRPETHSPTPEPITSRSGMLVVHSYGPAAAPPGAPLSAQVDFHNPSDTNVRLRIVFGEHTLPTSVILNDPSPDQALTIGKHKGAWKVLTLIPPVGQASTRATEVGPDGRPQWPLNLEALDTAGNVLDYVAFGWFVYESLPFSPNRPASDGSRSPNKRSREEDEAGGYSPPTPSKRFTMDTQAMNLRRLSVASASSSFIDPQQGVGTHGIFIDDGPPPVSSSTLPPGLPLSPHAFHHLQGPAPPQLHMPPKAFNIQPPTDDTYVDVAPSLVRTTQLLNGGESKESAKVAQATILIQDDLERMKHGWTESERQCGRRLVQFWKRQVGTTLHISFTEIPQHQYAENTVVISCIYRDNVEECFVTSVDVIYLLEALAGTRFEVEEKNRIRRNLEGFKPMTVSKSKPGTEDFFRALMEFPPPRPRNIEKDVKVFEWGKLGMMIEKVFSKYSTVPLVQNASLPRLERRASGSSGMLYTFPPENEATSSADAPHLPTAPVNPPKSRKKRSPAAISRLHDMPTTAPYSVPSQATHGYSDSFQPVKYEEYNGSGEYAFNFDIPLQVDPALLKVDVAFVNGNAGAESFDSPRFRPASPLSCDNSPMSMTLSLSSGPSSDGGSKNAETTRDLMSLSDPDALSRAHYV